MNYNFGIYFYFILELINYIKYRKKLKIIERPFYQPNRNSYKFVDEILNQKKNYSNFCFNPNQLMEKKSREYGYKCSSNEVINFFLKAFEIDSKNNDELLNNKINEFKDNNFDGVELENDEVSEGSMSFGKMNVMCVYRPLMIDISIDIIQKIVDVIYYFLGFRTHYISNGEYMQKYHIYKNNNTTKTIIFIHGLGIGTAPYLKFIQNFKNKYSIITIEINGLGTRFVNIAVGNFTNFTFTLERILKRHQLEFNNIILIGHSLGTDFVSSVNNVNNDHKLFYNSHIILLDPICFLHGLIRTHYPMFSNIDEFKKIFPYKSLQQKIKLLLFYYLFVRNISSQFVTKRVLSSATDIIFRDTKTKTFVYFGMKDDLIDAKNIERFVNKDNFPNIEKHILNESHGSFLYKKNILDILLSRINLFLENN